MKIRSVTIFNGRPDARDRDEIARAGRAASVVRKRLQAAGLEVQTMRLALAPAHTWTVGLGTAQTIGVAQAIELMANDAGIDYVSFGPVAAEFAQIEELKKVPELIAQTKAVFCSAPAADTAQNVNSWALRPIADAVKAIAASTANGFGNLRFAALAHCSPGIPFFPAAYAAAGEFSCALAIECADVALKAVAEHQTFPGVIEGLSREIELHDRRICAALDGVQVECGIRFQGCDWSLAPHPDAACSIGAALEKLSGAPFGEWGTLTAVAALTRGIRGARIRHVGFSGVFLPLLEDAVLAQRTMHVQELQKLLLYSAVCGSGLDTVPLAGDVSADAIAALLGDVATLASVLKKPLTARLMPIIDLKAGEKTAFDFPYLVNGNALPLSGHAPGLFGTEKIGFSF